MAIKITKENFKQYEDRLNHLLSIETRPGGDLDIEAVALGRAFEDYNDECVDTVSE